MPLIDLDAMDAMYAASISSKPGEFSVDSESDETYAWHDAITEAYPALAAELRQLRGELAEARAVFEEESNRLIDVIRRLDPENLCDFFDDIGAEECLRKWLAARDTRMKREGAITGVLYSIDAMSMAESGEEAMEIMAKEAARLRAEQGEG